MHLYYNCRHKMCNLRSCKLKRKLKKSSSEWHLNPWPVTLDSMVKNQKSLLRFLLVKYIQLSSWKEEDNFYYRWKFWFYVVTCTWINFVFLFQVYFNNGAQVWHYSLAIADMNIKNQLRSTSFDNHVIIVEYFETWEIYFVAGTVNH